MYQPCALITKKRYVGYMYESLSQETPELDAKGIETIRRDNCPAVGKVRVVITIMKWIILWRGIKYQSHTGNRVVYYICKMYMNSLFLFRAFRASVMKSYTF